MGRFRMISYAGCGFNGAYYLGVNKVLLSNLPKFIEKEPLYAGVSAGSISASSAAVFGLRNDDYELDFVKNFRAKAAKTRFSNELKHVLRELLDEYFPIDAHEICSGRVHLGITEMSGKHPKFGIHEKSVVKSSFDSKEEFVDTVLASCLVPYWAGTIPVTMNGVNYYDGGFTDNLLDIFPSKTVRVQPFSTSSNDANICPSSNHSKNMRITAGKHLTFYLTSENLERLFYRALFGGNDAWMNKIMKQGESDASLWLDNLTK